MCDWTKAYAESVGEQRKSLFERWTKVDVDEFYRPIGYHTRGIFKRAKSHGIIES